VNRNTNKRQKGLCERISEKDIQQAFVPIHIIQEKMKKKDEKGGLPQEQVSHM
jgi:hypothetical protein